MPENSLNRAHDRRGLGLFRSQAANGTRTTAVARLHAVRVGNGAASERDAIRLKDSGAAQNGGTQASFASVSMS